MRRFNTLESKVQSPTFSLARDNFILPEIPVQRPLSTAGVVTRDLNILAATRPGDLQGGDYAVELAGLHHLVALNMMTHVRADGGGQTECHLSDADWEPGSLLPQHEKSLILGHRVPGGSHGQEGVVGQGGAEPLVLLELAIINSVTHTAAGDALTREVG